MKWLSISLIIYLSLPIGCTNQTAHNINQEWPGKNNEILFEIKDTSKEDFIDQIDKSDSLNEDEKYVIKKYILDYTNMKMVKWKLNDDIRISMDQYILRPRSGMLMVFRIYNGKWALSCNSEYD